MVYRGATMSRIRKRVITQVFKGERYVDHGIGVDALAELAALKDMLIAAAKDLWKAKHPDCQRLPNGFESDLELRIYGIEGGSVSITLERLVEPKTQPLFEDEADELDEIDEAAAVISEAIDAAGKGQPVPDNLPKRVLPMFENFGKTLKEDECIVLRPASNQEGQDECKEVVYNQKVRELLSNWQPAQYTDKLTLVGELRLADLDGCKFKLRLNDGRKLEGAFSPDKEAMITDALHQHETRWLKLEVEAEYDSQTSKLKRITQVYDYMLVVPEDEAYVEGVPDIWDIVEEVSKDVPAEEWEKLPRDMSTRLDEYLYGEDK